MLRRFRCNAWDGVLCDISANKFKLIEFQIKHVLQRNTFSTSDKYRTGQKIVKNFSAVVGPAENVENTQPCISN